MAQKKYYLSKDKYSYFIRVFPEAERLDWKNDEDDFLFLKADLDLPDENFCKIMDKDSEDCLKRLKRDAFTDISLKPESIPQNPLPEMIMKKKSRSDNSFFRFVLVLALFFAMTCYDLITYPELFAPANDFLSDIFNKKKSPGRQKAGPDYTADTGDGFASLLKKNMEAENWGQNLNNNNQNSRDELISWGSPESVTQQLAKCRKLIAKNLLTTGDNGNAFDCYCKVLVMSPDDPRALAGIKKIEDIFAKWAELAAKRKNFKKVKQYIEGIEKVNPGSDLLPELMKTLPREWQEKIAAGKNIEEKSDKGSKDIKPESRNIASKAAENPDTDTLSTDDLTRISLGSGFQTNKDGKDNE
ncbi:hypothetical protein QUF76_06525 [Desulfobacterales bacterium HSG16]|nr:hypothetical protein [Desulfobacterales bacterium HSG16]